MPSAPGDVIQSKQNHDDRLGLLQMGQSGGSEQELNTSWTCQHGLWVHTKHGFTETQEIRHSSL